ncbi:hypothetical protein [Chamaesiphon sp. OTE_8_metabat_110]|nr:hypothetical protein [Chamaesiphon sp. OTE_8_metabat_110]
MRKSGCYRVAHLSLLDFSSAIEGCFSIVTVVEVDKLLRAEVKG